MNRLAPWLALAVGLLCIHQGMADTLDFSRGDHRLHAGVGAAGAVVASEMARTLGVAPEIAPIVAGMAVVGASMAKEVFDKTPSAGDVQASCIGAAAGVMLAYTIHL